MNNNSIKHIVHINSYTYKVSVNKFSASPLNLTREKMFVDYCNVSELF